MPYSSSTFDLILKEHIAKLAPSKMLDVGTGAGKNGLIARTILPSLQLEGIEPTTEYIKNFNLLNIYDKIYETDIQTFSKQYSQNRYDIVIFGDVLEHLFRSEVIDYIDYFSYRSKWIIAIWPTGLPQDNNFDNFYEIHKNNFKLDDLSSKFDISYYVKNQGWKYHEFYGECEFNYCVLKGYFTDKSTSIYNFRNFDS